MELGFYKARPIVYLDKSCFKNHAYRAYGYSAKGPCHGIHDWQLKNSKNAIVLLLVKLYCGLEGRVKCECFLRLDRTRLIPELPKKRFIIMDNAAFHKRQDIQEILKKAGHEILWLPPYSPNHNPIEEV